MIAIDKLLELCEKTGEQKLQDLTPQRILYVTVEPCIMCAYAFRLLKLTCIFLDAIMRGLEVVAQCLMCTQYVVCKCTS